MEESTKPVKALKPVASRDRRDMGRGGREHKACQGTETSMIEGVPPAHPIMTMTVEESTKPVKALKQVNFVRPFISLYLRWKRAQSLSRH